MIYIIHVGTEWFLYHLLYVPNNYIINSLIKDMNLTLTNIYLLNYYKKIKDQIIKILALFFKSLNTILKI